MIPVFIILTQAFFCCLLSPTHGQASQIPRYSLDSMPSTKFSCRDKIIGGYYADPETQCQMFHVCVKVAGIGIQDFRFLCPNGTAFDQEAQICADWGDIDCGQATLYYGSDNFDLYRIGTGFESKRANVPAEEEEGDFHLQRAESSDARRSKQFVGNQISRSDKPAAPSKPLPARPILSTARPFQTTPPSSTTSARTEAPVAVSTYRASPSTYYSPTPPPIVVRESYSSPHPAFTREDEIFRGSHSSNFFNNQNGKDDYDFSHPNHFQVHPRPNSSSTSTSTTTQRPTTTTQRPTSPPTQHPIVVQEQPTKPRNRGRGHIKAKATADPHFLAIYGSKRDFSVFETKPTKSQVSTRLTQQYQPVSRQSTTTSAPLKLVPNPVEVEAVRQKPKQAFLEFDKFNKPLKPAQADKFVSSTPQYSSKYTQFSENSVAPKSSKAFLSFNDIFNTSLPASSPSPFQKTYDTRSTTTFKPPTPFQINNLDRNSPPNRFYNTKYETTGTDFGFPTSSASPIQDIKPSTYNPHSFGRSGPTPQTIKLNPQEIRRVDDFRSRATEVTTYSPSVTPRYQIVSRPQDNITPSTAKKFSTLVPKELYGPTTFKPNQYVFRETTKFTTTTTTIAPVPEGDEDDGQYRPELYEKDLYKNKLKAKLARTGLKTSTTKASASKDDDELFAISQSQNIAASGNELRAERARQAVKEINKILEKASSSSTTQAPKTEDNDASYDYAYYDFGDEKKNEFDAYGELIEEFGKTKGKSKH